MVAEAERAIGSHREDAARLRSEIREQDKLIVGLTGLLLDPDMADTAKLAIKRQLASVGARIVELQASLDAVGDRANDTSEEILRKAKELFQKARERFEAVGTPAELHAFVERFVGSSLARPEGQVVPRLSVNEDTTGESGGAISM
jgi:hypothetical protein